MIDNLGHRTPNVWIQERFEPPMPPSQWQINSETEFWQTEDSGLNAHPTGRFGPAPLDANGYDNLVVWGSQPWIHQDHPNEPLYAIIHHY